MIALFLADYQTREQIFILFFKPSFDIPHISENRTI